MTCDAIKQLIRNSNEARDDGGDQDDDDDDELGGRRRNLRLTVGRYS